MKNEYKDGVAQSNRMMLKEAQSNRMMLKDAQSNRKKHNLTECATAR